MSHLQLEIDDVQSVVHVTYVDENPSIVLSRVTQTVIHSSTGINSFSRLNLFDSRGHICNESYIYVCTVL